MPFRVDAILSLEGTILEGGWTVGKLVRAGPIGSGGNFSICYLARNTDGAEGFLKAFDFRRAFESADLLRTLQQLTTSYVFERDLLEICRVERMNKIVVAKSNGEIDATGVQMERIFYIIFELADGDARDQIQISTKKNFVWIYSALHHIATGLQSLHKNGIFHQDLKPSNILVFNGGVENKIADLGRSHCDIINSPNGEMPIPGFVAYAPPEQHYGYEILDSHQRRSAADLYQLGSLIFFFFTGSMATPSLFAALNSAHRPDGVARWTGTYEGVLPYLDNAFDETVRVLNEAMLGEIPDEFGEKFIPLTLSLFKMMCAVRPEQRRGHGKGRIVYDLQRVISDLDNLAKRASLIDRKNAKAA
jgi:eukaryotic-like serine/threonine-protein kinase